MKHSNPSRRSAGRPGLLRAGLAARVVALSLLFALGGRADAQVRLGLKGGPSSTTVNVENAAAERFTPRTGVALGGVIEIPLRPVLRLQVEPSFVQRGSGVEFGADLDNLHTSSRLDYFALPVLAKVTAGRGAVAPYAMAGPSIGVIVSESFTIGDGPPEWTDALARNVDMTIELEGGVEVPVRLGDGSSFSFGVRYSRGLVDVSTTDAGVVRSEGVLALAGVLVRL